MYESFPFKVKNLLKLYFSELKISGLFLNFFYSRYCPWWEKDRYCEYCNIVVQVNFYKLVLNGVMNYELGELNR